MEFVVWEEKQQRDEGEGWWEKFSEIKCKGSLTHRVGEDEGKEEEKMTIVSQTTGNNRSREECDWGGEGKSPRLVAACSRELRKVEEDMPNTQLECGSQERT